MILASLMESFAEWSSLSGLVAIFQQLACWICLFRKRLRGADTLQFLEFYAGEGQLTAGMLAAGYRCKSFEIRMQPHSEEHVSHDLLSPLGLRYAMVSLMMSAEETMQMLASCCM